MTSSHPTPGVRRARRAYLIVGVLAPLVVTAVAVALMIAWLPEVPSTVAVHWGPSGRADGFGPAWLVPLVVGTVGVALPLLITVLVLAGSRGGEWGATYRFCAAVELGAVVFLAVGMTSSFASQRGIDDAVDAPSIAVPLAVGALAGAVAGVIGWMLQPAVALSGDRRGRVPAPMDLGPGERAAWLRSTAMPTPAGVAALGAVLVLAVLAVVFGFTGNPAWWVLALLAVVLALAAATTLVFRVRVDAAGLHVAALLGVPRFHVAPEDIDEVRVLRIDPLTDFGGWGVRISLDGRLGVVLHRGEALQVARHSGRTLVVTVDDAERAAALLEAVAGRARSRG